MASAARKGKPKRGMGRGLSAILPESTPEAAVGELRELPVGLIKPNPKQPRTKFDADALAGLAASIESSGVVQPLLVRPLHDGSYELIAGERRWRAAQQAGLEKVPAIVRDSEHAERLQVALIENMVREDLNPVEEARACAALVEDLGLSKEDLARRIGRSRPAVSNLIRLLDLPDEALELLESGELSEGHGRALLGVSGNDVRRRLARDAARGGWSVRETENRVKLASQPRHRTEPRDALSAEEAAAMADAADKLETALGHEVKVRSRGGEVAVEIRLADLDEALALAAIIARSSGD
ncbi:MAG TPA: ParB/RepB/Spo0J family partition protein [Solirubrobacterales bacterium]|nr:ParB/RepB/Spo0J family partition protein [Solirubrobacterales bacterium]